MNLRIQTQDAQIGIQQGIGDLYISQNHHFLQIQTLYPEIYIQQEDPVLLIDQSQCFSEAGLKSNQELSRQFAAKGRQNALRAIAKIADEGNAMADIQNGVVIGRLAKNKMKAQEKQFAFDMIPKSRPEMRFQKGETHIRYQKGDIKTHVPPNPVNIHYNTRDVKVYLKQKNYIQIDYVGKKVDLYGG
ncbi:hypothetical protein SAMN05446037_101176 [Anaerovirgula multivorans]|uniref:Uncharacterized protein n=1 Tax=Anaerovirgula multivorans TaxID=312168 RepID=A0A239EZ59_9FIRM|nr:DUF6470 family protein [Anaerovirgula multivorans]SNS49192.1 hypothetical protein SAMN05446037_101176 [Anaerovirgula multivorans]